LDLAGLQWDLLEIIAATLTARRTTSKELHDYEKNVKR